MRIVCTVDELVSIARGCSEFRQRNTGCTKCPFYDVCGNHAGFIEQFIAAHDVIDNEEDADGSQAD